MIKLFLNLFYILGSMDLYIISDKKLKRKKIKIKIKMGIEPPCVGEILVVVQRSTYHATARMNKEA